MSIPYDTRTATLLFATLDAIQAALAPQTFMVVPPPAGAAGSFHVTWEIGVDGWWVRVAAKANGRVRVALYGPTSELTLHAVLLEHDDAARLDALAKGLAAKIARRTTRENPL